MQIRDSGRRSRRSTMSSRPASDLLHEDYVRRVQTRLHRSCAITSSRSVLSLTDACIMPEEEYVVDVGVGKRPNLTEQLLARLEQHGLRRCNVDEDDFSEFTASPEVVYEEAQAQQEVEMTYAYQQKDEVRIEDSRKGYYYICVPCEMRLTKVSTHAAIHKMLEDVHYHFSSATHRSTASWMGDPDIDVTLTNSPLLDVSGYTRIFVNGVPMLLSGRPGGGDMFYALPHEQDRFCPDVRVVRRGPPPYHTLGSETGLSKQCNASESERTSLYPSVRYSSNTTFWYRPLASMCCRKTRQIVSRLDVGMESTWQKRKIRLQQSITRRLIRVDRVSVEMYKLNAKVNSSIVPMIPALYPILRRRIHKKPTSGATCFGLSTQSRPEGAYRCQYVQPRQPYLCSTSIDSPTADCEGEEWICDRFIVESEGVYRIALLSQNEIVRLKDECDDFDRETGACMTISALSVGAQHTDTVMTAPLTQEMLTQLTQDTTFKRKRLSNQAGSLSSTYASLSYLQSSSSAESSEKSFDPTR